MNSYPLIRNRWSNEHLLAVLFFAVSLYQLPDWTSSAVSVLPYFLIVAAALFLDAAINYIRYSEPVCAVSSAVTAAVLYPVIKGLPGWAGLLGVAAALIIGKHIWGGTGKNIFNPAVISMFFLSMLFPMGLDLFKPSYLLLPAMLLSLPFIAVRLFPGAGLMTGMLAALFMTNSLDAWSFAAYGAIYWSCTVITDPATATDKPIAGLLLGFAAGFIPMYFSPSLLALSSALLVFNLLSYMVDGYLGRKKGIHLSGIKLKSPLEPMKPSVEAIDLTGDKECTEGDWRALEPETILQRIRDNEVFGMGGAGFSTVTKIETAIKSGAKEKYLVINGMECDPGLIHDKWLVHNRQAEIRKGIEVLTRLAGFNKIYYIAKDTGGIDLPKQVEIKLMPDRYPFGAEKLFVKKLLGIDIAYGSNPAQYGVLVLNVQTVFSIYEAVCCNKKADTRFITAAELFTGTARVARVRLGERIDDIAEKTVGDKGITFVGGGIMQAHPALEGEVVERTTNFIAAGMLPRYKESHQCINCGLCRLCCPRGLNVKKIAELLDEGRQLEAQTYNYGGCISCGLCSYVCPAGRNLSGRMAQKKPETV